MADDARLIGLDKWASRFDPPPSKHSVRQWIKRGLIQPEPQKVGRRFYFDPDAAYFSPDQAKAEKLKNRVLRG